MKEIVYSGYNQVTCKRICDYLKAHEIQYNVRVSNILSALVRNKTVVTVKKDVLTDADRAQIQIIIDSSIEF